MKINKKLLLPLLICLPVLMNAQGEAKTGAFANERFRYVSDNSGSYAKTEAQLTVALLQKKYNFDSATSKTLINLFYSKRLQLDKIFVDHAGNADLENRVSATIEKFDTEIEKYIYSAGSNQFIQQQIALLDSTKPLTPKERKAITNVFLNQCRKNPGKRFIDNFHKSMHMVLTDTIYYAMLYKDEINKQSINNVKQTSNNLVRNNPVTKEGMKAITGLLHQKERSLLLINYAHPDYTRAKDTMIQKVTNRYDSLIEWALLRDGCFKVRSKFSIALQYRQILKLADGQVDSLFNKAVALQQLKADFDSKKMEGKFNAKAIESEQLPSILNEEQYEHLLRTVNHQQALEWARGDWEEMKARGITEGYDSTTVTHQIYKYDLEILTIKDRYAHDAIKLNAALKTVPAQPSALKKLKAARAANPNRVKGNLKW